MTRQGTRLLFITAVRRNSGKGRSLIISPKHTSMSYLHELRQELEQILGDALAEDTKKAILKFVGTKVYDSWKNGIEHGKAEARLGTSENAFKKSGKRFSKKPHQSEPNGSQQ